MAPDLGARQDAFFQPHNEKLFALIGRRFAWGAGSRPA
jgi:hypothetical protein